MTVQIFSQQDFENALTGTSFETLGFEQGELCYAVATAHPQVRVKIRTSIRANGKSAGTGEDSIRLILETNNSGSWKAIGKGPDAYTQRVKGWQRRLSDKLGQVQQRAGRIARTIAPNEKVRFAKTAANSGRPFSFVWDAQAGKDSFGRWLDR